jgi:hypothetical protein
LTTPPPIPNFAAQNLLRWLAFLIIANFATFSACANPVAATQEPVAAPQRPAPAANEATAARKQPGISEAKQIAALIDPAKLATLKQRGANPRIQKITAILATAKLAGMNPQEITAEAIGLIGWAGTARGELTAAAITRNLDIAEKLGATTPEDIAKMRRGNAPTVRKGPYAWEILSVDHVIPRVSPRASAV